MTDRRRRWENQQRELGNVQVRVWVPQEYEFKIKADAAQYRKRKQGKGGGQ